MILDVYKDIIEEINLNKDYFHTNSTYFRVLSDQLADVLDEEIYSKMSTPQGRADKQSMSWNANYNKKIVQKLSQIYTFEDSIERNPTSDQELVDYYMKALNPNTQLQRGTEYFNNSKSTLMHITHSKRDMMPRWNPIPNDRYWLYTTDPVDQTSPEYVVLIIKTIKYKDRNRWRTEDLLFIYSDTEFLAVDTGGKIHDQYMPKGNDGQGLGWVNTMGFLPFVHVNKDHWSLMPCADKDTLSSLLQVNSALTDALVANYYQAFPIITATGVDENATFDRNPNSINILNAPQGSNVTPEIKVIPSSLDVMKTINMAGELLGMLMDTKGLKVNSQNAKSNISGFQELINNADTTEVKKLQIQLWKPAEEELWQKTAQYHNYLVTKMGASLPANFPKTTFSNDFKMEVEFGNVDTNVEQQQNLEEGKDNGPAKEED